MSRSVLALFDLFIGSTVISYTKIHRVLEIQPAYKGTVFYPERAQLD